MKYCVVLHRFVFINNNNNNNTIFQMQPHTIKKENTVKEKKNKFHTKKTSPQCAVLTWNVHFSVIPFH